MYFLRQNYIYMYIGIQETFDEGTKIYASMKVDL
jgi:hypothetical protein